ncbi:MAG: DNA mismatch repair endonuclease MutL [Cytophagales bacterium]|nr:DNA mismatch repair endonuclease MutL [Cytophagales bacterium]
MQDIIQLLPDSIANQIAAGEVVQRPASAVKEMLENSVDAGATIINVVVKDAGKGMIQVIDNGRGMSVTDARMSFERHATSKIRTFDDLLKIQTKGFRGEALASIAAVAQVELKSRREEDELGTQISIEASEVKKQEPTQTSQGTSICVKNLFYNVPARRNFLKSNPVEFRHISDEFHRVALAHPSIAFQLKHNDLDIYQLDEGKLSKRIVQLFGKKYHEQLIACEEELADVLVTGYVGKPEHAKKTRGEQYFFINHRYIKNPYLNHAVSKAYEGLLKEDYFPFYVLNIEMDPMQVDVNVHPTKTEVKFADDRTLYGVIQSAVRQALAAFNVTPSLDFSTDINFEHFTQKRSDRFDSAKDRAYGNFQTIDSNKGVEHWEKLYQDADEEEQRMIEQATKEGAGRTESVRFESSLLPEESTFSKQKSYQLHDAYLLRQVKSGMVLLDKEAALERIFFEKIDNTTSGASQSSLFPQQIGLNGPDYVLVMELKEEIESLGFRFETMGEQMIVIQGVPADLAPCNEKEIFEGLIEQFKDNAKNLELPRRESLNRALAKRIATTRCKQLGEEEADHLIDQLFACNQPNYTPEGKPTYVLISLDKINSWFHK